MPAKALRKKKTMGVASVAVQFTIIDLLSRGVDRIKGKMQSLAAANKDVQRSFDRMAQSGKYAAMAGVATVAIARGLRPAVTAAGDLQGEMLGVRAEMAGGVKEAKVLESQLKRVKATAFTVQAWSPYNMTQIVALEKELLKAGAKIEAISGPQGAAAASASLGMYEGLDPVDTGKKLVGIATPFKLEANQYMDLADKISRASSAAVVGAAEIAETAKYAASGMASLGRSVDEMLTISAMLAQRGVDSSMAGVGMRQFFNSAAKIKGFRDANGDLKSLTEITELLTAKLSKLGEAERSVVLTKMFDVRGAIVAEALMDKGAASYEQIAAEMEKSLPLQEKVRIRMEGFFAQLTSLRGTSTSVLADLFQAALTPLTGLVSKTNEFVTALGEAAQKNESIGKAVSGLSLGAVGAGGLATVGFGAGALWYGRKVLKGVGGFKGLLGGAASATAGIAAGKAVEAATGVQPVFVTNWPAGGVGGGTSLVTDDGLLKKTPAGGGGGGVAVDAAAGAAAGGALKKMAGKAGFLAKMALPYIGTAAAAGAGGYLVGTGINQGLGGMSGMLSGGKYGGEGWLGDMLYDLFNKDQGRETKNDINLQIAIDQNGRVVTQTSDPNTHTKINTMRRGSFAQPAMASAH